MLKEGIIMKKALSVLLAAFMLLGVVPFAAFATDDTAPAARFILKECMLEAVDLSAFIESDATINKGLLKLVNYTLAEAAEAENDQNRSYAKFDPQEPGVFYVGFLADDDVFEADPLSLEAYNYTFTVQALTGNLYDDVKTFSFTVKDVFDGISGEQQIMQLPSPKASVSKLDGNQVKEIAFDFRSDVADFLPNTVDLSKVITLAVRSFGVEFYVTAMPVRYANGILTTLLLDEDGKEGVPLHNLEIASIDGNSAGYAWTFTFSFPSGILCYNDQLSSQQVSFRFFGESIEGIPIQTALNIKLPRWLKKLDNKPSISDRTATFLVTIMIPFIAPFPISRMMTAIRKSLSTYGLDSDQDLRAALRGSLREFLGRN